MRPSWLRWGKGPDPVQAAAERLHDAAVAGAREPRLYVDGHAPDTVEGRFELLTLHVIMLLERLRAREGGSGSLGQIFFDTYVSHLDGAMREMGVGDLAMARRMKGLGETFYGRAKAWDEAVAKLPDMSAVEALVGRTVLEGVDASPTPLAALLLKRRQGLQTQSDAALARGEARWS